MRLKAAVFATVSRHGSHLSEDELRNRLAALRAAAEERGYEVVLEKVGRTPPYVAPEYPQDLLDAAHAGSFHALILHDVRELGPSRSDAAWLRHRIEAAGSWIIELRNA